MKANEFIKRNGLKYAKERIEYCKGARLVGMEIELKRLVESHDYIDDLGGLKRARDILKNTIKIENMVVKPKVVIEGVTESERISYHIANVESCL